MDSYYETHVHDFAPKRLTTLVPEILSRCDAPSSLADVGCGTGNTMVAFADQLGIDSPVGIDSSENLVRIAAERTGHEVINASVLDTEFAEKIERKFDVVTLSAVLHHVVGRTRRTSISNAALAVENAKAIVAPGGVLVIHEPLFRPSASLSVLFYAKLLIGSIAGGRRVPVGTYWANIGAPLVSYLTPGQLRTLTQPYDYFMLEKTAMPTIAKFGGIFARYDSSVIIKVRQQTAV